MSTNALARGPRSAIRESSQVAPVAALEKVACDGLRTKKAGARSTPARLDLRPCPGWRRRGPLRPTGAGCFGSPRGDSLLRRPPAYANLPGNLESSPETGSAPWAKPIEKNAKRARNDGNRTLPLAEPASGDEHRRIDDAFGGPKKSSKQAPPPMKRCRPRPELGTAARKHPRARATTRQCNNVANGGPECFLRPQALLPAAALAQLRC